MRKHSAEDWRRLGRRVYQARIRAGYSDTQQWATAVGRSTRMLLGLERGEAVGNGTLDLVAATLEWPDELPYTILDDLPDALAVPPPLPEDSVRQVFVSHGDPVWERALGEQVRNARNKLMHGGDLDDDERAALEHVLEVAELNDLKARIQLLTHDQRLQVSRLVDDLLAQHDLEVPDFGHEGANVVTFNLSGVDLDEAARTDIHGRPVEPAGRKLRRDLDAHDDDSQDAGGMDPA